MSVKNKAVGKIKLMKNKLACVTGASAGIGEATAKIFAAKGFDLVLLARRLDRLSKFKEQLVSDFGVRVHAFPLDVSNSQEVKAFGEREAALLSQVEILVNNAGLARGRESFQESETSHWDEMIDTNVKGLLYLTRILVRHMLKKDSGHIVNLGSVAGRWTYPNGTVYCATKFAVRAISEGLRMDLLGSKIRVTNVEPGLVESEFSIVRFGDVEKAKLVYKGLTPLTPEDIAETIAWCTDRPPHVNIQEIVIYPTDQASVQNVHRR